MCALFWQVEIGNIKRLSIIPELNPIPYFAGTAVSTQHHAPTMALSPCQDSLRSNHNVAAKRRAVEGLRAQDIKTVPTSNTSDSEPHENAVLSGSRNCEATDRSTRVLRPNSWNKRTVGLLDLGIRTLCAPVTHTAISSFMLIHEPARIEETEDGFTWPLQNIWIHAYSRRYTKDAVSLV